MDLGNFARTNIQVISSKLNHFALGILKTKPEKNQEKIFSQMLSIPCPLQSMRSVGSHCLKNLTNVQKASLIFKLS